MGKQPIEMMLDGVTWTATRDPSEPVPQGLYATHEGVLEIEGMSLKVYKLNDGQRVFDADDFVEFFNRGD